MKHQHLSEAKNLNAIAFSNRESAISFSQSLHPIEQLQAVVGNRAVNQLLANQPTVQAKPMFRGLSQELVVQPKLTIGAVGDKYEQEADSPPKMLHERITPSDIHQENKTQLPDNLKAGIENLSGMGMDDVKIHYNSSKPSELRALAYTQGTNIHIAPGQEKHLPHEAWHVVQQKQGRVKPTLQAKGAAINDDRELEREADVMGAKVSQATRSNGLATTAEKISPLAFSVQTVPFLSSNMPVQRVKDGDYKELLEKIKEKLQQEGIKKFAICSSKNFFYKQVKNKLTINNEKAWEEMSVEKAANDFVDKIKKEKLNAPIDSMQTQGETWTENTKFRDPPTLYNAQGEKLQGKPIDFTIEGLGKGRIALYQHVGGASYKGVLAWMSHGLQLSQQSSQVQNKSRSFGFAVAENKNLLRPSNRGGFDSALDRFNTKRGKSIKPTNTTPPMVLGAHDPSIDFHTQKDREAIGSILPKADLAILVDFVPFSKLDRQFQNPEMSYLDFTYAPLDAVMTNLPKELQEYDDFLMLCCRTQISEKMKGNSAEIQNEMQVQNFQGHQNIQEIDKKSNGIYIQGQAILNSRNIKTEFVEVGFYEQEYREDGIPLEQQAQLQNLMKQALDSSFYMGKAINTKTKMILSIEFSNIDEAEIFFDLLVNQLKK